MIHIYPVKHLFNGLPVVRTTVESNFLWGDREHLFFESGKDAIRHTMRLLGVNRGDEVAILTSSDSTYVSTCVTATIFNHCKISRVIGNNTRSIYVIHEFGVPHPHIRDLSALARERGIPLIEDCAHSFDSAVDGQRIGTFGDYSLYSLSKLLPMVRGGLLVGDTLHQETLLVPELSKQSIRSEFERFLPYLGALSDARKRNHDWWVKKFPELKTAFEARNEWTPYAVVFRTDDAAEFYRSFDNVGAEWGRTHVPDWITVPTQPLASKYERSAAASVLRNFLNRPSRGDC